MRPIPHWLSLWLLLPAHIEARKAAQPRSQTQQHLPTAVRKMPPDQGAKFHHEYCAFPEHHASPVLSPHQPHAAIAARETLEDDDALRIWANASAELPLRPPFAVLSGPEQEEEEEARAPPPPQPWDLFRRAASALARLERRQWACPTGTRSCSAIGYPNSCCGEGETCMEVPDTGLGPVGCCPVGATCGGGILDCAEGSTACGSEIGGGCCIPGFVCQGVGCIRPPPPKPTLTTLTTTSTSIISLPTPSTVIITIITTITPSTSPKPITSTVIQTSTASPSSPSTPSSGGAGAPLRPTSSPPNPNNPGTSSGTNTFCPTGFYPCLARAGGGCCQTGRDCATSSCPPPQEMTTVVDGNGVTVVVPLDSVATAAAGATTAGGCADGWFLCRGGTNGGGGDGDGGEDGSGNGEGCCPTGYECGTASCFAGVGAGQTASVAKGLPGRSRAGRVGVDVGVLMAVVAAVGGLVGFV